MMANQPPFTKPVKQAYLCVPKPHPAYPDATNVAVVEYADGTGNAFYLTPAGEWCPYFIEGVAFKYEPCGFLDTTCYAVQVAPKTW